MPKRTTTWATSCCEQGKLDEAAARFEQALALRPDYRRSAQQPGHHAAEQQGKLDEAAARYQQALALRPDYAEAQLGLATCYLVEGDYERGWPAYEGRLRMPGLVPQHSLPRWTGEPLAGRSLLLLAEQGLGDTLHFVRYARLLKERGARVVLAAQAALGRLLASHPDVDELFILGSAEELPRCDFYLPLLSAPGAFRTDASTIPCEVPYLWADPELTDEWRAGTGGNRAASRSASSGKARAIFVSDRWRSIPLAHFAPLASLPGVRLVSLQKGFGSEQVATVDFPVLDLSGRLDEAAGPFMDTAAVIRNLDLVVTPDTAIAHLAGALGVPVWVALPFSPDWRWLRDRDDSPWYPTMRLFRQTTFGEWPDVFERIANAVQAKLPGTYLIWFLTPSFGSRPVRGRSAFRTASRTSGRISAAMKKLPVMAISPSAAHPLAGSVPGGTRIGGHLAGLPAQLTGHRRQFGGRQCARIVLIAGKDDSLETADQRPQHAAHVLVARGGKDQHPRPGRKTLDPAWP